MNYTQARDFLANSMKFGSRLGLERMSGLMRILGQPAMDIPCIHIAGTNGKGSVTTMIANVLASSGLKTGIYTSPFIHRFSERIRIIDSAEEVRMLYDDETTGEISEADVVECVSEVAAATDVLLAEGGEHPTEFELVTAAAFIYFQKQSCDFMVLETGLGGRLDSTNVVEKPLTCVITAIGYDHMDRLGSTIAEIASEKAGIIKKGSQVMLLDPFAYTSGEDARIITDIITKAAGDKGADSLTIVSADRISELITSLEGQSFVLSLTGITGEGERILKIDSTMPGTFQPLNCLLAASAVAGMVTDSDIYAGIRYSRWPGRFEVLRKEAPLAIIDGAHNIQGIRALRDSLEKLCTGRDMVFMLGVMADKDYRSMLSEILFSEKYSVKTVICAKPDNPRALPAEDLAVAVQEILDNSWLSGYNILVKVLAVSDPAKAAATALEEAEKTGAAMIAFGSLYMSGIVRSTVLSYGKNKTGVL